MFSLLSNRWLAIFFIFASAMTASQYANALTESEALAMATGEVDARVAAINKVVNATAGVDDRLLINYLDSLGADEVRVGNNAALIVKEGVAKNALGQTVTLPAVTEDIVNNNRIRGAIDAAKASIALFDKDESVRAKALVELKDQADEDRLPALDKAYSLEPLPQLKAQIALLRAAVLIQSSDSSRRLEAAKLLGTSHSKNARSLIVERLKNDSEKDPAVRLALTKALGDVDARLAWGERLGVIFTGVSLGSILLLVALGLAITYGLMGVINMAHGELMMIGAYATYVIQNLFRSYLPGLFDYYVLLAIPASFLAAALVGAFRTLHPGVVVRLAHPDGTSDLIRSVRAGDSEVGITELSTSTVDGLIARPLGRQEIVVVLPPTAAAVTEISATELAQLAIIAQPVGTSTRALLDGLLAAVGETANVVVETDHRDAVVPLVLAGAGAALLPRAMAERARVQGAHIAVVSSGLWRDLALVHRDVRLSPAGAAFVSFVCRNPRWLNPASSDPAMSTRL